MNNIGEGLKTMATIVKKNVEQNIMNKEEAVERLQKITESIDSFMRENVQRRTAKVPLQMKKLENFSGPLPKYESSLASGFDVRAMLDEPVTLKPGERTMIPTGLAFAIPPGYEIQSRPRSGLAARQGISIVNTPGTIDADYRGEVKVILINHGQEEVVIESGERVAQFVLAPVVQAEFDLVSELDSTDRGAGGFGSTGKN